MPPFLWKKFVLRNRFIVVASLIFIVWKFFLIGTLWHDRFIPPGPDDSYIYILHIDSTLRCGNFFSCNDRAFSFDTYGGFDHLSYRLILGTLGKIMNLDAVGAYHAGFYLGTILLAGILILFLSRLDTPSQPVIAFSLLTLALYNGSGSYHGFFWVVPSFYALLFFLSILTIVLDDKIKHWYWWIFFLLPLAIYTHVLGMYLLAVLPCFFVIYSVFTRNFQTLMLKKILCILLTALIVYIPVGVYFAKFSYGNPYGPEIIAKNIISQKAIVDTLSRQKNHHESPEPHFSSAKLTAETLLPGWSKIVSDYFRWIFPSFIGYIIFLICFSILWYKKQFKLIALYLASLCFTFVSSLSIHGERSLILLWPLTFLLYGQAAWFASSIIIEKIHRQSLITVLKILVIIAIVFAAFTAILYSYLWNSYLSQVRNIHVTPELTTHLMASTEEKDFVAYSKDMNFLDALMMLNFGSAKPAKTIMMPLASRYVTLKPEKRTADIVSYKSTFHKFFNFVSHVFLFKKEDENQAHEEEFMPYPHLRFVKEVEYGEVEVYQIDSSP